MEIEKSMNVMFRSLINYLLCMETIVFFVAVSQKADLINHLETGEALSKVLFAMGRIKCSNSDTQTHGRNLKMATYLSPKGTSLLYPLR